MQSPDHYRPTPAPVAAILMAALLLTFGFAAIFLRLPAQAALSWAALVLLALLYVLTAVVIYRVVAWILARIAHDHLENASSRLMAGGWQAAVWLPAFLLLTREHSVWVALILPVAAISAVNFVRAVTAVTSESNGSFALLRNDASLFSTEKRSATRIVLPSIVASIAVQLGIAALLLERDQLAAPLFAITAGLLAWMLPLRPRAADSTLKNRMLAWSSFAHAFLAILCVAIALTPFLRYGEIAWRMGELLHPPRADASARILKSNAHPGSAYSGIVLYAPVKQQRKVVVPALMRETHLVVSRTRPTEIEFDGVYWYFEPPDERPKPDAKVVHGDPMKSNIHSTGNWPIAMIANQDFASPVETSCCRYLRVRFVNGDSRPGPIYLEVTLRRRRANGTVSQQLGSLVIPSSQGDHSQLNRWPAQGFLDFPVPRNSRFTKFDEISVTIVPYRKNVTSGARVAIQGFVLFP